MRPGEILYLRGGSCYGPDGMSKVTVTGTAERRIEIRAYPGEQAGLQGHLWLTEQTHHVTVGGPPA